MKKKFAVGYNVFDDSIELLESSIKSVRDSVDKVYVVYQTISNFGNLATEPIEEILNDLISKKLVDEIYLYKPKLNGNGHYNEITKRNIGYFMAEGDGMDYYMTMDSDELYDKEQLEYIKNFYINEDLDSGYCQMQTYYKSSEYVLDPPEEYYVSLFYKIRKGIKFEMGYPCSVLVDPTRIQDSGNTKVFTRDEIEMHHYSYVRNNIRKKLKNSSASVNFSNDIDRIVEHYENFDFNKSDKVLWGGLPSKFLTVKKIK